MRTKHWTRTKHDTHIVSLQISISYNLIREKSQINKIYDDDNLIFLCANISSTVYWFNKEETLMIYLISYYARNINFWTTKRQKETNKKFGNLKCSNISNFHFWIERLLQCLKAELFSTSIIILVGFPRIEFFFIKLGI